MRARRGTLALLAATLIGCALLTSLGVWQLQRLAWKEAILARLDTRAATPPVALPPRADWDSLTPDDYDYRRVTVTGHFDHAHEAHVFRSLPEAKAGNGGPGYLVITPLALESGGTVLVDRGFVPLDRADPATRALGQVGGEVTLTGLMRPPETRNPFTPPDEPAKNVWFTRDPRAIAAALSVVDAAPFTVDADAGQAPGGLPMGGQTVVDIPNNHLSYAFTWFGLAATLLVVSGAFAWRRRDAA